MSTISIIFICIGCVIAVAAGIWYAITWQREEEKSRIPGPDEIEIIDEDFHEIAPGDFYIKDSRNDFNPFESYNIYRIDAVRKNIYGDLWVKYTAPGFDCNLNPKWKELECPLHTFMQGKVRVQKIKK